MKPYAVKKLSFDYQIDRELLRLLSEASEKYGQYKVLLKMLDFDFEKFSESLLLNEVCSSYRIEGVKIDQNIGSEIRNYKKAIELAYEQLSNSQQLNLKLVNEMHKIILGSIIGPEKSSGEIRTVQNWIGLSGCGIENATFIPPPSENVEGLLTNLYEYMNNAFVDPLLINVAISHAQFEMIHPYRDGNGRLGRVLIPIQMAMLDDEKPILYLSEIIERYKKSYYHHLMKSRNGDMTAFIKFFLHCVIEECNNNIFRIHQIKN